MSDKDKDATNSKPQPTQGSILAHTIEMDRILIKQAQTEAKLDAVTKELVAAKQAMKRIEADYTKEICTKLAMDIQMILGITDLERDKLCHGKSDKELSQMLENYATATQARKPATEDEGTFKHIRTGAAEPRAYGDTSENFTVGNLFGKTAKEIKEMGGKF